jgi:hypothetical protein
MNEKPPPTALAITGEVVDSTGVSWTRDATGLSPWDKLPEETSRAYEAFCEYRDMGVGKRSVPKMAAALGVNTSFITVWRQKFGWVARVEAWDAYQQRLADEAHDLAMQEAALLWERRRQKAAERKWDVSKKLASVVRRKLDSITDPSKIDINDLIKLATLMNTLMDSALATGEGGDDNFDAHNATYEELEVYLKKWGVNVPKVKRSTRSNATSTVGPKELGGGSFTDVDGDDNGT